MSCGKSCLIASICKQYLDIWISEHLNIYCIYRSLILFFSRVKWVVGVKITITVCKFHCDFFNHLLTGTKTYIILMIMDSTFSQTWAIFLPSRKLIKFTHCTIAMSPPPPSPPWNYSYQTIQYKTIPNHIKPYQTITNHNKQYQSRRKR